MTDTSLWTPPRGFVLAGPNSAAFAHLQTHGLQYVNASPDAMTIKPFRDGSAFVSAYGKTFPLPLRMLNGPNNLPTPEDGERILALHEAGWPQHALWWTHMDTDPIAAAEKLRPVFPTLSAYLAGKVAPYLELRRIEIALQGAAPDVPEDAPSQDACLMARVVSSGPSSSPNAKTAQAIMDKVCEAVGCALFDSANPPRSWRWAKKEFGDQHTPGWIRETPFVFRLTASVERVPNAHETMKLAHALHAATGVAV